MSGIHTTFLPNTKVKITNRLTTGQCSSERSGNN